MNPAALQLAAELGGAWLSAPEGGLILVERAASHTAPRVAVLGARAADLREPLEAIADLQAQGLDLTLVGLLPPPGETPPPVLAPHARRIGALVAGLDAGLPWLEGKPMLVRRLPGRIQAPEPATLAKAPMGPLEKAELKAFLPGWDKARRREAFRLPEWREDSGGFETDLWPGVALPEGSRMRIPPLVLPEATALTDILRAALRRATGQAVPFLPHPGDPAPLHALRSLTPDIAAFRGPREAWCRALEGLAALPGPPHFCARC